MKHAQLQQAGRLVAVVREIMRQVAPGGRIGVQPAVQSPRGVEAHAANRVVQPLAEGGLDGRLTSRGQRFERAEAHGPHQGIVIGGRGEQRGGHLRLLAPPPQHAGRDRPPEPFGSVLQCSATRLSTTWSAPCFARARIRARSREGRFMRSPYHFSTASRDHSTSRSSWQRVQALGMPNSRVSTGSGIVKPWSWRGWRCMYTVCACGIRAEVTALPGFVLTMRRRFNIRRRGGGRGVTDHAQVVAEDAHLAEMRLVAVNAPHIRSVHPAAQERRQLEILVPNLPIRIKQVRLVRNAQRIMVKIVFPRPEVAGQV